jgi:hypothetical protein
MTKILVAEKDNISEIEEKKTKNPNVKMHFNQILMFWYIDKSPRYLKKKQEHETKQNKNSCISFSK